MARSVKCKYCGQALDRDTEAFEMVGTRYAHKRCIIAHDANKTEKEKLCDYICNLFDTDFINPKVQKQIKQFIEEYHYTYSGIINTLEYFYRIQKHDITKANDGIGIVPYVYNQARKYYFDIYQANLKNNNKDLKKYKEPKVIEVTITSPKRETREEKLFSFIENDEVIDDEQ